MSTLRTALTLLLLSASALAQAPLTLTYQGSLANAAGQVLPPGDRQITFRIYADPEANGALWTEVHDEVPIEPDGTFTVHLGDLTPLPVEDPQGPLYLGVTVADDLEIIPRMRVGGAMRAQWAAVAAQADDVRDRHIHPASVSIGDQPVIDADGRWLGDPTGLGGPAGADGDDGQAGVEGPAGQQGAAGPKGDKGDPGDPAQGPLTNIFHESPTAGDTPVLIPRADPEHPALSYIDVGLSGTLESIAITVDIEHPDIGGLTLTLVAPNGDAYILHQGQAAGAPANLATSYPPDPTVTPLDALNGQSVQGRWILRAEDHSVGHAAASRTIRAWGLAIVRAADDAWRLEGDLVVEGGVASRSECLVTPLELNGQAVPNAIVLTCGNQAPIQLRTLQCAQSEVCNGIDDDCNGMADDEPIDVGAVCDTGEPGVCAAGVEMCIEGRLNCTPNALPGLDACDGVDNDCDGAVDEDFPSLGEQCFTGLGACRTEGRVVCREDRLTVVCDAVPGEPSDDVCDRMNMDDDCDGVVNNGRYSPGLPPGQTPGVGVCHRICYECGVGGVVTSGGDRKSVPRLSNRPAAMGSWRRRSQ